MFSHSKQTIPHFMDKLKIGLSKHMDLKVSAMTESGKGHKIEKAFLLPMWFRLSTTASYIIKMIGVDWQVWSWWRLQNHGTKLPVRFNLFDKFSDACELGWLSVSIGEIENGLHWTLRCNFKEDDCRAQLDMPYKPGQVTNCLIPKFERTALSNCSTKKNSTEPIIICSDLLLVLMMT